MNTATTPHTTPAGGTAYATRRPGAPARPLEPGDRVRTYVWDFPPTGPPTSRPAYGTVTGVTDGGRLVIRTDVSGGRVVHRWAAALHR